MLAEESEIFMRRKEEKPLWIVFSLVGLLVVPVIFVIGLVIGININGVLNPTTDTLSSWVTAFATVAIAVLTFVLAKETWYLRLSQILQVEELRIESIRPSLEFYLLSAPASFQFMNVHIENNGKGAAKNVFFEFSGENGHKLNDHERMVVDKFFKLNILRNGMVSLGAGKQRTSFIFSFIDFSKELKEDAFSIRINVKMKYTDAENRIYASESVLDFSEFKGITEIGGGDPIYNLYKETEKIRLIFEGAQGNMSSKRLNVNAFSSQDRTDEQEATRKWIEEQNKNQSS